MQIRDPRMFPDEPPGPPGPGGPAGPPPETLSCRVSLSLPWLKIGGAAALLLLAAVIATDGVRLALAGVAALALAIWAVRDLVAPVRLAADRAGVTVVVGFATRRRLDWSQIERVRVDTKPRLGLRTETLEIDTGETLHLFSAYDLGARPSEVATRLAALRPNR